MGRSPGLLAPTPALKTNQDPDLFKASDRLEMGEEAHALPLGPCLPVCRGSLDLGWE